MSTNETPEEQPETTPEDILVFENFVQAREEAPIEVPTDAHGRPHLQAMLAALHAEYAGQAQYLERQARNATVEQHTPAAIMYKSGAEVLGVAARRLKATVDAWTAAAVKWKNENE